LTILSFLLQLSHFTHHQFGSSWPEHGLKLTVQTKGCTNRSGAELASYWRKSVFPIFSTLLMCAGFRFPPFGFFRPGQLKNFQNYLAFITNAFIFTFPSLIVSNITVLLYLYRHRSDGE
jgi:hypothetical protein